MLSRWLMVQLPITREGPVLDQMIIGTCTPIGPPCDRRAGRRSYCHCRTRCLRSRSLSPSALPAVATRRHRSERDELGLPSAHALSLSTKTASQNTPRTSRTSRARFLKARR
jgi:hypothetical protein